MAKRSQKRRLECLRLLLRPAARYCINNSMTLQDIFLVAKEVLVDVADDEMRKQNKKVNISRLSVMTGVHRRDVMKIFNDGERLDESISLVSRVISQWENDRRFKGKNGRPKVLSLKGDRSQFRKLVSTVSQDLNPGTVLFELERSGMVEKTDKGLKLKSVAHVQKGADEGFELLARDNEDLVLSVVENVEDQPKPLNLHARTEFTNLYVDDVPTVRKWLLKEGTAFHKKVRNYLAKYDKDINPKASKSGGARAVLCAYSRVDLDDAA